MLFRSFEAAIHWLVDAGLVLKVNRIEKPTLPLNAYADYDAFKLFLLDIGLLNTIANVDKKILLEKNTILTEYKGALTEQFVCQQLKTKTEIYYWTAENATAEIDFIVQYQNEAIPIEMGESDISATIKGKGYFATPETVDRKALKLARKRILFNYTVRDESQEALYGKIR